MEEGRRSLAPSIAARRLDQLVDADVLGVVLVAPDSDGVVPADVLEAQLRRYLDLAQPGAVRVEDGPVERGGAGRRARQRGRGALGDPQVAAGVHDDRPVCGFMVRSDDVAEHPLDAFDDGRSTFRAVAYELEPAAPVGLAVLCRDGLRLVGAPHGPPELAELARAGALAAIV